MPFGNLLDDIGGQLLQSSEEFLLFQLRQPSSKKRNKTKKKSKKMRGGVTRKLLTRRKVADRSTLKAQDLTRLNRDVFGEIRAFHPLLTPKLNNINLRQAIIDYLSDDFYTIKPRART